MQSRKSSAAIMLLLAVFGLAYSQAQIPNTFEAGQPARAAEVNENFSAVAADINAVAGIVAPMTFKFVGFSSGVIMSHHGIYAMGALCRADYGPNARLARAGEAFDFTGIPLGSSQGGAWVEAAQEGSFSSNDTNCAGWTVSQGDDTPFASTIDDQGRLRSGTVPGYRISCSGSRPVACSVLQ